MTYATHRIKKRRAENVRAAYGSNGAARENYDPRGRRADFGPRGQYGAGSYIAPKAAPARAAAVTRRRVVKRKKPVVYEKSSEKTQSLGKWFFIYAFVFFLGAMLMIMFNARLAEKKRAIAALREELRVTQEKNRDTRLMLLADFDEAELTEAAKRAGMGPPHPYQIININVPKDSYVKGGGAPGDTDGARVSVFSIISDFFGKFRKGA